MEFGKYKKNLHIEDNRIISYTTHVATIYHAERKVIKHGWWSVTTSKHINYVASELGYEVKDNTEEPALDMVFASVA